MGLGGGGTWDTQDKSEGPAQSGPLVPGAQTRWGHWCRRAKPPPDGG